MLLPIDWLAEFVDLPESTKSRIDDLVRELRKG